MKRTLIAVALVALLPACSAAPPDAANQAAAVPVGSLGGVDPAAVATGLPDSPDPHPAPPLDPIVREDLADKGLLGSGCAFHGVAGGPMLLAVRDEGDGLAKFDKRMRRLAAATPGREAIMGGGILAGDGVTFTVTPKAGSPATVDGTTQSWPATLDMRTADGGERVYAGGRWSCGS